MNAMSCINRAVRPAQHHRGGVALTRTRGVPSPVRGDASTCLGYPSEVGLGPCMPSLVPSRSSGARTGATRINRRSLGLVTVAAAAGGGGEGSAPPSQDLLVVGPGVLGGYMGKLWKDSHPGSSCVGMTITDSNHARLKSLGLEAHVREDVLSAGKKYANVLFSAPPSGSKDKEGGYAGDVKEALSLWDGSGSFLLTSSMGVCSVDDGSVAREDAPNFPVGASPRTDTLLGAEQTALEGGGNVLRLVGLYHANRGAHTFFLKAKEVQRYGGYTLNLLHYEDAARMSFSIMAGEGSGPFRSRIFLGCDNNPVTFKDMMDYCNLSGVPELTGEVTFTATEPDSSNKNKGRQCYNEVSRDMLGGWSPKYDSIKSFMEGGAVDFYKTSGLY